MKRRILLLAFALLAAGCGEPRVPETSLPVVKVHKVSEVEISTTRQRYAGTLAPYSQINLNFENSAYVQEVMLVPKNGATVLVDAGDPLTAGTVLARQDPSEFEASAAQARANVKSAQAQVSEAQAKLSQALAGQAQAFAGLQQAEEGFRTAEDKLRQARAVRRQAIATLAKATAQREETRKSFERASVLYREEAMVKPEYDKSLADFEIAVSNVAAARAQIQQSTAEIAAAESQARSARASIAGAQAQVRSAQAQVESAQQGVDAAEAGLDGATANLRRAEISLSHCDLKVPTDSVLVSRNVAPGTLAGPGATAFVVADIRRVKAVFGVPDVEVDQLKVGQDVRVSLEAFPATPLKGRISSISPSADSKGRIYDVAVMLDNHDGKLKNGMIASIELVHKGLERAALTVPLSALVRSPTRTDAYAVVVVVDENARTVAHVRDVKIGRAMGNQVEVTQGLKPTDSVVVGGNNLVNDGQPVQVEQ